MGNEVSAAARAISLATCMHKHADFNRVCASCGMEMLRDFLDVAFLVFSSCSLCRKDQVWSCMVLDPGIQDSA